ncbi:MAG: hypothetical protein LLG14_21795 [Nocardiaceae bacterium]|nr:hypothetical protein [Nocardiaceae bacterium]
MTRQTTALTMSVVAVAIGLFLPATVGWLLVIAGLTAAVSCAFAAQRLAPELRMPWFLLAFGQLLNGLGNMMIAFDSTKWVSAPDWVSAVIFNSATIVTVMGIIGLCLAPAARRLITVALDLLVITGCAFGLGVMWDLGRFFGHPAGDADNLLGLMGFLAVVVGFVGLAFCVVAWNAQPRGGRAAYRFAALAHVSATVGDTEMLVNYLGIKFEVVSLTWLASSLLILIASQYLPGLGQPVKVLGRHTLSVVAVVFGLVQVASLILRPIPNGELRVVLVVVLAIAALRLLGMLGREPVASTESVPW